MGYLGRLIIIGTALAHACPPHYAGANEMGGSRAHVVYPNRR
jgi:hypothetical protein